MLPPESYRQPLNKVQTASGLGSLHARNEPADPLFRGATASPPQGERTAATGRYGQPVPTDYDQPVPVSLYSLLTRYLRKFGTIRPHSLSQDQTGLGNRAIMEPQDDKRSTVGIVQCKNYYQRVIWENNH